MAFRLGAPALALSLAVASGAAAQQGDTLRIQSVAPLLSVQTVTAGEEPGAVLDSASTYSVSTSASGYKIVARLESAMPPGTSMAVRFEAPPGAVSHGFVTLTTLDQLLVSSIPAGSATGLRITYRFRTTLAAGVLATTGRSVLFTLNSGP